MVEVGVCAPAVHGGSRALGDGSDTLPRRTLAPSAVSGGHRG